MLLLGALLAPVGAPFAASTSAAPPLLDAGETSARGRSAEDPLLAERVEEIQRKAHAVLVDWQNTDGSFSVPRRDVANNQIKKAPVAVTALSALALMAHGHLPDRGGDEKSRAVRRAIQWLIEHCQEDGPEAGYFRDDADTVSKMHGHGYALLALTQAAGSWGNRDAEREALDGAIRRAVGLVERTQGLQGAWYYEPRRTPSHEGSITVCMIQGLRAAKDAGYTVDPAVIARAVEYMSKSQDPESGKFRYELGSERTSWALTAAALATLNSLGEYDGEMLRDGHDAMERHDPWLGHGRDEGFRIYGSFYAAQAYWVHPDRRRFERWWKGFVDACERQQATSDGAFYDRSYGRVYATAMVSLSLAVPFGTMPLFQR